MATGKFYAMAVWAEGDLPPAEKYYYGFTYVTQDGRLGFATSKWDVPPNSAIIPMRNPSSLYYLTMEAKLHIFDGIGLSHYRMIYESEPDSLWLSVLERAKQSGIEINETDVLSIAVNDAINRARYGVSPAFFSQEVLVKYTYLRLYSFQLGIPLPTFMPTGYVKIFERVKGAKITGKAPENTTVELNVTIKTNQNRTFNYVAITKAENGTYQFIVPYAQDTGYDVRPITPYYLKAGETVKTLNVTEMQVLNGEELKIDLT
jgi:dolichyl-diphosphooligosaccharide--protein glycosyltransferase